jgi:hypothetical protein
MIENSLNKLRDELIRTGNRPDPDIQLIVLHVTGIALNVTAPRWVGQFLTSRRTSGYSLVLIL